jgi:hypothetical protein
MAIYRVLFTFDSERNKKLTAIDSLLTARGISAASLLVVVGTAFLNRILNSGGIN